MFLKFPEYLMTMFAIKISDSSTTMTQNYECCSTVRYGCLFQEHYQFKYYRLECSYSICSHYIAPNEIFVSEILLVIERRQI